MGRPVVNQLRPTIGDIGAAQPFQPNSDQYFTLVVPAAFEFVNPLDGDWYGTKNLQNVLLPGTLEVINFSAVTVGLDFGLVNNALLMTQFTPNPAVPPDTVPTFQAVCPPFSLARFRWPEQQRQLRRYSYTLDAVLAPISDAPQGGYFGPSSVLPPPGVVSFAVLEEVLDTNVSTFGPSAGMGTLDYEFLTVDINRGDPPVDLLAQWRSADVFVREASVSVLDPHGLGLGAQAAIYNSQASALAVGPDGISIGSSTGIVPVPNPGYSGAFQADGGLWAICSYSSSVRVSVMATLE